MNIFVPFTQLRAETFAACKDVAQLVPLFDDFDYSRYFITRWRKGETFINIEHDIVPTLEILQEMWDCPQPWCSCSYRKYDQHPYFGCVKFSAEFIKLHSDMWVERPWGNCDVYLANRATVPSHWHGIVQHIQKPINYAVFDEPRKDLTVPNLRIL